MDIDRNSQVMIRLAANVENLRRTQVVGDRAYYKLIEAYRRDLFALLKEPNRVMKTVMTSMDEQYDLFKGEIPSSHHLFEINVLLTFKLEELCNETVLEIYERIFPRLDSVKDTYHLLSFLDKVFRKLTIKEKELEILRKLQSLICPSDKRSARLVTSIIEYILKNWDCPDEQENRFEELIRLPKWSKLEFHVCKVFYETHVASVTLFQTVLERIFQGFQENYTAYSANILFAKVVSSSNNVFYNVTESYVTCLLEKDIEQRTLHSSLITYVIPTMSDYARTKFIQRSFSFKPIYRLHTIKYYYHKSHISNIDTELLNDICRKNSKDNAIVKLVWELCCSFSRSNCSITKQHLALFTNCIEHHCDGLDDFLQNHINSFLSQIIISMIRDDRLMYLEFFNRLAKLVEKLIDNFTQMRKSPKATLLMLRSYLTLRTRFQIPDTLMYRENQNHKDRLTREWNIMKFYIRSGFGSDVLYSLNKPYYIGYNPPFTQMVRKSLMVALTNPNLDMLEHVRIYTKILLKMYKDYSNTLELDNLLSDVVDTLRFQLQNIKGSQSKLMGLANPIYASGEALHIIAEEYPECDLVFIFSTADQIIRDTLPLVDAITDVYTRKFIEQIFITHIQLLKTCTKRLCYGKPQVNQFLYLCEQVMCKTKFRKATSVAYNASLSVILSCRPQPLFKEIIGHLVQRLDVHLVEVEQVALNRCSGNKEMLLLTFKSLGNDPTKFAMHFERMLNVSQGHQELHLVALEAICSDAELKELTAPYLVAVFKKTIGVMSHSNFRSRNAATQLIQVLTNRFMGTKSELGHRPLCVLQAFERHPKLAQTCFNALFGSNNNKFGILTFIGDSPYSTTIFGESHGFPRAKIKNLMDIKGIKMLATKAFAMTVHSQYLYRILSETIEELQSGKFTPCNLLFTEYLLVKFINSEGDESVIQEIITKFENFLDSPIVMASPDAKKYLVYADCQRYKLDLHYKYVKNNVAQTLGIIRKCLSLDNFVVLSFICFYIELIFHKFEDGNKRKLFRRLNDVFTKFNGGSSLMIHQYYSSIKNLLVNVPKDITIDIGSCNICHIFIAEIITFSLRKKNVLLEQEKTVLKYLKDNLAILIKQCDKTNEKQSSSVVSTLTNLLYLFPEIGLLKLDFYFLLFIGLLHVSDKNKFCEIFKIITNRNCSISHYIQCLPKIIKQDLSTDYGLFIKSAAKYVSCNLNDFFIEYTCLYNCPEDFTNVKIDVFLLRMVLEEILFVL